MERRTFVALLASAAVPGVSLPALDDPGRLLARPHPPRLSAKPGLTMMGLAKDRDTQLMIPASYSPTKAAGLMVGLHGATQNSAFTLRILREAAESHGYILVAPNSRDVTWDLIRSKRADDEVLIDKALEWVFDHCNVDSSKVVVAGFSDGASAALTLGKINGDLFKRVIAFSPGFVIDGAVHGKPPIFISHGTRDQILPIDETSRRLVPALKREGYNVTYREFDGPHAAPAEMIAAAMAWLGDPAPR